MCVNGDSFDAVANIVRCSRMFIVSSNTERYRHFEKYENRKKRFSVRRTDDKREYWIFFIAFLFGHHILSVRFLLFGILSEKSWKFIENFVNWLHITQLMVVCVECLLFRIVFT